MKRFKDIYSLSRSFWDFSFQNPEKIRPIHAALFFFAVDLCNRYGWKEKFGLPTSMAKEAIGVGSYNTYIAAFRDLVDWGFFVLIEKSKNQYSSNVIALSIVDKASNDASNKALDHALMNHASKQLKYNNTNIQSYNDTNNNEHSRFTTNMFPFKKSLIKLGVDEKIAADWLQVRKQKRAANTETAFKSIKCEIALSGLSANECIRIAVENSWSGLKADWILNLNKNESRKQNNIDAESAARKAEIMRLAAEACK